MKGWLRMVLHELALAWHEAWATWGFRALLLVLVLGQLLALAIVLAVRFS